MKKIKRFGPKGILVLLLTLVSINSYSQSAYIDTLNKRLKTPPKLVLGFDARRSFAYNHQIKISGFRIGVDLGNTIRFGYGLYWLEKPIYYSKIVNEGTAAQDTAITRYNFSYISFFLEYVLWHNKHWEFTVTNQFGVGSSTISTSFAIAGEPRTATQPILLDEPSVGIQYKIFQWLGIGTGYGYRFILNDQNLRNHLDDHIYFLKMKLFLGPIWRAVFPKEKKEKTLKK